jgi:hypothetical protein
MNKFVEEAPYHPGYEDAVIIPESTRPQNSWQIWGIGIQELEELIKIKERHLQTASNIIEFMKGGQKWQR